MVRFRIGLPLLLLAAACTGKRFPPTPANLQVREPLADSVESVVFLVGDAGMAQLESSPLLLTLRREVDQWSQRLGREGAVTVLYLGDNVYPRGLRDSNTPEFPLDSAILQSQLDVMTAENTRQLKTTAVFIAGNHDWGHLTGAAGRDRLFNMASFIARRSRLANFQGTLLPRPGDATVARFDVGRHIRLLLIDSAWWLLEANLADKQRFIAHMERELANTEGRAIVIAAHHPWSSGSSHGGIIPFWKTIGLRWLLNRTGTTLQDINSLPYRALRNQLNDLFTKHGAPLLWAGGHDHNLQVMKGTLANEPRFDIVSGAGSKTSLVAPIPSTMFARAEPGFMRLVAMKNGNIDLFVVSAPDSFLKCLGNEAVRLQCVEAGSKEFRTVYSIRLR